MKDTILQGITAVITEGGYDPSFIRLEKPKQAEHGDYATALALAIGKQTKQNPLEVAKVLSEKITQKLPADFTTVTVAPPGFINFHFTDKTLAAYIKELVKQEKVVVKPRVGSDSSKKIRIVIEYSAPNIAKPMGVGHLRSTIIGQALVNIYRALGYDVITTNHLGDWGTQFGKLIVAFKKWGSQAAFDKEPINHLLNLYVRFTNEAKSDEALNDAARTEFRKLEQGDRKNVTLWQQFRDLSLKELERIYTRLGTTIDHQMGEADYRDQVDAVYNLLLEKGLVNKDGDALVLNLADQGLGTTILRRSDEGSVYITRDVAQVLWRLKHWQPDEIVYVVAQDQSLHFKQLFSTIKALGVLGDTKLVHVGFGLVLLDGKRMRTREGTIIFLEDVLDEAVKKAKAIVEQKNPNLSQEDTYHSAEVIGIGSVIYNDLSQNRLTTIGFDWDKMLSLEGNSAPYLMYSLARARSVLAKAGPVTNLGVVEQLGPPERRLIRQLSYFDEAVKEAAVTFSPNIVANYLFELAGAFNGFYATEPIIHADQEQKPLRLAVTQATARVLDQGLRLLSITPPERM